MLKFALLLLSQFALPATTSSHPSPVRVHPPLTKVYRPLSHAKVRPPLSHVKVRPPLSHAKAHACAYLSDGNSGHVVQ